MSGGCSQSPHPAPSQPFPLDFFQTSITLCDLLVEVYHKFTLFLNNGRDVGTWNSSMAKDMDSAEAHYATVTASTLETMNKIDVKVKVRSCSAVIHPPSLC